MHECDQGNSKFTNLFNNALCGAIMACRDNPVVSPPDVEGTTSCLQNVKWEKRELLWKIRWGEQMTTEKLSCRPCRCQQGLETASSYRLETSSYTIVCSTMQHVVNQEQYMTGIEHTPTKRSMTAILSKLKIAASAINCKWSEIRSETDKLNAYN